MRLCLILMLLVEAISVAISLLKLSASLLKLCDLAPQVFLSFPMVACFLLKLLSLLRQFSYLLLSSLPQIIQLVCQLVSLISLLFKLPFCFT